MGCKTRVFIRIFRITLTFSFIFAGCFNTLAIKFLLITHLIFFI